MAAYLVGFEGRGSGLARPIQLDPSEVFIGNVIELESNGIKSRYEIVEIGDGGTLPARTMTPTRKTATVPPRLILRKVD